MYSYFHYVLSNILLLKQVCMNLAVARITTGSADDNNSVRIFSWFIFWISGIILEEVLYNNFFSSVKYVHELSIKLVSRRFPSLVEQLLLSIGT